MQYATPLNAKYSNWYGYDSYASTSDVVYNTNGSAQHTTGVYSFPLGTYEVRPCYELQTIGSRTGAQHCTYRS